MSGTFVRAQSLCSCLGFAFAEGQTVFLLQFLADADIPLQPVAAGDAFAIVIHTIEDEVAMGIGSVMVTDYDILGNFVEQNNSTYHKIKKYYYICILYDMLSIHYGQKYYGNTSSEKT